MKFTFFDLSVFVSCGVYAMRGKVVSILLSGIDTTDERVRLM